MSEARIPTHRCIHCTLVRCFTAHVACEECIANGASLPVPIIYGQRFEVGETVYFPFTDDRSVETCREKFDNMLSFKGELFIPIPEDGASEFFRYSEVLTQQVAEAFMVPAHLLNPGPVLVPHSFQSLTASSFQTIFDVLDPIWDGTCDNPPPPKA